MEVHACNPNAWEVEAGRRISNSRVAWITYSEKTERERGQEGGRTGGKEEGRKEGSKEKRQEEPTSNGGCSGFNSEPEKDITPSPKLQHCKCDHVWKLDLCRYN
jgi:hypothetical protein